MKGPRHSVVRPVRGCALFWAIAMLAVARLHFRNIMGNLLMVFFLYFIFTPIAFLYFVPNW